MDLPDWISALKRPKEIALSVMAEIKMVLSGKNGQPLREKKGPIHGQVACHFPF